MDPVENSESYTNDFLLSKKFFKKRKGGKKRNKPFQIKVNSEDIPSVLEDTSVVEKTADLNLSEESENEGIEEENRIMDIKVVENFEDGESNLYQDPDSSRIHKDGMMKAPPQIAVSPEKENDIWEKEEYAPQQTQHEKEILYNTRALSRNATTYELEKFEKNALIIFNQEKIEGYKPRLGTEKDVKALTNTFGNYGFEVTEHKDLNKDDVFKELKTFSDMDFTDYGCVVVAVLTHGSKNGLLRAKDQPYSEIEIVNHFKVYDKPTLVTKPRILIIQACRGVKGIQGVPVLQAGRIRRDVDEDVEPYYLPVESDMLVLHSSYIGNPAHRDELHGSWFIQSLCSKINQLASTHDFESIITEMKREVAIDRYHEEYNRRTFEVDTNKQMPVMTSTLIRKLYLKKCNEETITVDFCPNTMKSSTNEVLDASSSVPNTPLRVQFGPCSCFLDHFHYIRDCLRYYLEDTPRDLTAQAFLDVATTFEDGVEFNATKETMLKAICNHLMINSKDSHYFKYLHFYKN